MNVALARAMTGLEAIREINSLGLFMCLSRKGAILITPKDLVEPYRDDLTAIIAPIRDEIVQELQRADKAIYDLCEREARKRGLRMTVLTPEGPKVIVPWPR